MFDNVVYPGSKPSDSMNKRETPDDYRGAEDSRPKRRGITYREPSRRDRPNKEMPKVPDIEDAASLRTDYCGYQRHCPSCFFHTGRMPPPVRAVTAALEKKNGVKPTRLCLKMASIREAIERGVYDTREAAEAAKIKLSRELARHQKLRVIPRRLSFYPQESSLTLMKVEYLDPINIKCVGVQEVVPEAGVPETGEAGARASVAKKYKIQTEPADPLPFEKIKDQRYSFMAVENRVYILPDPGSGGIHPQLDGWLSEVWFTKQHGELASHSVQCGEFRLEIRAGGKPCVYFNDISGNYRSPKQEGVIPPFFAHCVLHQVGHEIDLGAPRWGKGVLVTANQDPEQEKPVPDHPHGAETEDDESDSVLSSFCCF